MLKNKEVGGNREMLAKGYKVTHVKNEQDWTVPLLFDIDSDYITHVDFEFVGSSFFGLLSVEIADDYYSIQLGLDL